MPFHALLQICSFIFHELLLYSYKYIFLSRNWSFHTMLLVCMFSGLTAWNYLTRWCVLLWGRQPLHTQLSSVAASSLSRVEASFSKKYF